jgi:hypothetical protein
MQNYKHIEFNCLEEKCGKPVAFELLKVEERPLIKCSNCGKEYNLNGSFAGKMRKFDNLISAVRDAREILGDTNVAVKFKNNEIRIPYRLLLTRMNTLLTLNIGEKKVEFRFRVEPLKEDELDVRISKA